ncbi:MAG: hypothetical protein Q4D38_08600 [Planctomycetia bacterium]|nr:hypothetical protein [Planctomycetia bacterium]
MFQSRHLMIVLCLFSFMWTSTLLAEESTDYVAKSSGDVKKDVADLLQNLFDQDLPNATEQQKADILTLAGKIAEELGVPKLTLHARRSESDTVIQWALGSELATVWDFVVIQDGKITRVSNFRSNGTCDGEPFGRCCGGLVGEPMRWETEEERIIVRDAIFRLIHDCTYFTPLDGLLPGDLPSFEQMPNLEGIDVLGYEFTPESIQYFNQFPKLQSIRVSRCSLDTLTTISKLRVTNFSARIYRTAESTAESAAEPKPSDTEPSEPNSTCPITRLDLAGDVDGTIIAQLRHFPELETLSIRSQQMSGAELRHLRELPKLRTFCLRATLTDTLGSTIEIADLPQLRSLDLWIGSTETRREIEELFPKNLDIQKWLDTREGFRFELRRLPQLQDFSIYPVRCGHLTIHLGTLPMLKEFSMYSRHSLTFEPGTTLPKLRSARGAPINEQTTQLFQTSPQFQFPPTPPRQSNNARD